VEGKGLYLSGSFCVIMLDDELRRFRLGRKICDDMIYDYLHPKDSRFSEGIHATRVDGINEQKSFWEAMGYLSIVTKNLVKHPNALYDIYIKRK